MEHQTTILFPVDFPGSWLRVAALTPWKEACSQFSQKNASCNIFSQLWSIFWALPSCQTAVNCKLRLLAVCTHFTSILTWPCLYLILHWLHGDPLRSTQLCCSPLIWNKFLSYFTAAYLHAEGYYWWGTGWGYELRLCFAETDLKPFASIGTDLSQPQQGSPVGSTWNVANLFFFFPTSKCAGGKCFQRFFIFLWLFPVHLFRWDKLTLIALLSEHEFSAVPSGFLWPRYWHWVI